MRKTISLLFVCLSLLIVFFTYIPTQAKAVSTSVECSEVRVKLSIGSVTSKDITLDGTYTLKEDPSVSLSRSKYTIKLSSGKLYLYNSSGSKLYSGSTITFLSGEHVAGKNNYAQIYNDRYSSTINYTGDIIFKISSGYILCINNVYMENYVAGVIPYEMGEGKALDALKVQAVCARTYAAIQINSSASYDVLDTSSDQVYRGYDAGNVNSMRAVEETAHQLLAYNGQLVQAYYTATNGGFTELPQHIWSSTATLMPYQRVKADKYDIAYSSTHSSYEEKITIPANSPESCTESNVIKYFKDEFKSILNNKGYNIDLYEEMNINSISAITPYELRTGQKVGATGQDHSIHWDEAGNCLNYTGYKITANVSALTEKYGEGVEMRAANTTVNVKASNSSSSETIATVNKGYVFTVEQYDYSSSYHKVSADGSIGYVNKSNVELWGTSEIEIETDFLEFESTGSYPVFDKTNFRLITVEKSADNFVIYHRRYGHGVGMSQCGVMNQAGSGRTYNEILSFYFPETEIVKGNISGELYWKQNEPSVKVNGIVTGSGVNIRSGPGTSYTSLGKASLNQNVYITAMYYSSEWHQIWVNGTIAYMHKDYLKIDTPQIESVITWESPVELRVTPDLSANIAATIPTGTSISVIGTGYPDEEWSMVWHNSRLYYTKFSEEEETTGYTVSGVVTGSGVNIRTGPGTSYTSLGKADKNDKFQVTAMYYTSEWHQIIYNDSVAYMHKDYLSVTTPNILSVITKDSAVSLRVKPDTSADVAATIAAGNSINVIGTGYPDEEWSMVWHNSRLYYAKLDEAEPEPTPVVTGTYGTATGGLNLRSTASGSASVVIKFPKGSAIEVVKTSTPNSSWNKVKYNGKEYYAMSNYMSVGTKGVAPSNTAKTVLQDANIYLGVGTSTTKLGSVAAGGKVYVIKENFDTTWAQILYSGTIGYIQRTAFVAPVTTTPTPTPTAPIITTEPSPVITPEPTPTVTGTYGTATGGLNLRATASGSASVVIKFPKGSAIEVVKASTPNSSWNKVKYNGKEYYAMSNYMSVGTKGVAPSTVTKAVLQSQNIYLGAGTGTTKLGSASKGGKVYVIKENFDTNWAQILYNGNIAYIPREAFVAATTTTPTTTSQTSPSATTVVTTPTVVSGTYGVATGGLNLRATASGSASVVIKFPKGSAIEVVKTSTPNSSWHKVKYNGKEYYAMSNYMTVLSKGKMPTVTAGKCNATDVNVRMAPGTSYTQVGLLAKNETVYVIKTNFATNWTQVWYNNNIAYVYSKYITV